MPTLPARRLMPFLTALVALSSGCAVGPDFRRPAPPTGVAYTEVPLASEIPPGPATVTAQRLAPGADLPFRWWSLFGSQALDDLVEQAFTSNPTVTSAQAALRQAEEAVDAQRGFFYPTIQAGYTFERQKLAGNLGGNSPGIQGDGSTISTYQNPSAPPYNGPVIYNFHTAQVTVGYVPDAFGGLRRQVESLTAQAQAQRFELEAAYVTLASNVVAAAIQEASTRAQLAAARQIVDDNERSLTILRNQLRVGFASEIDVAAQETALAQARSAIPPLERTLEQTRDLLRALLGRLPSEAVVTFELADLHLPEVLPVSLPSKLIDQRPDVRAAEEGLRAANAEVGAAIAARLPQFAITAADGGAASHLGEMFRTGGPFWNLIGSVTQTVFDGNTLLHRQRGAEQALRQAAAVYRTTVIAAYQNVADSLHAIVSDGDFERAASDAEAAARRALEVNRRRQAVGYVDFLTLYAAEQAYEQTRITRIQAETARLGDTAALFQALGGGWWNRTTVASARP